MPRVLPWLKAGNESAGGASSASATSKPSKPKLQPAYRAFRDKGRDDDFTTHRGSSLSPPSSPVEPPPTIEDMKPGDEDWIMVEDELYSTAQLFTRHLHRAEYRKLQKLAKENAEASAIVRPTVGRPTKQDTPVQRAKDRRRQIDSAVGDTPGDASQESDEGLEEEEDLIVDDRNLAGLLFGEEHVKDLSQRQMTDMASAKPKTRAAAGLGRQRHGPTSSLPSKRVDLRHATTSGRHLAGGDDDHTDDDEDDLDALIAPGGSTSISKKSDGSARHQSRVRTPEFQSDGIPSSPPITGSHQSRSAARRASGSANLAINDLGHAEDPENSFADARVERWKERREARRQAKVKVEDVPPSSSPPKQTMNDIPMFLG